MSKATARAELLALVRQQQSAVQRQCRQPRADERVWTYTFEHAKLAKPVYLHFLPEHTDDSAPIKVVLRHNVNAATGWSYRQPCPGAETCPVCRYRVDHPEFCVASDRQRYASNVLIIEDPVVPKHLRQPHYAIYEYGREIHNMIAEALQEGCNPFDAQYNYSLFRLEATWNSKRAVPKYGASYFTEWLDYFKDVRESAEKIDRVELPRLSDYPLMHDQDELDFQFSKTLAALTKPKMSEPERVGGSVDYRR